MNERTSEFVPRWYHRRRAQLGGAILGLGLIVAAPTVADFTTTPPSAETVQDIQRVIDTSPEVNYEAARPQSKALAEANGDTERPQDIENIVRGIGIALVLASGSAAAAANPTIREQFSLGTTPTTGPQ